MSTRDIIIEKDAENDILYVIKKGLDTKKIMNYHMTADIVLRKDANSNEIVGVTIEDFSKILPDFANLDEYHLMERFEGVLEFLNAPDLVSSLS